MMKFPSRFLWGAATSAIQSEGHSSLNGKSLTTWDKWYTLDPDKFTKNQGPENASNLYEMYVDDVELMKKIGMNSYRTSLSWARLLPDGKTVNQEAVAFYRDYFKKMLNNNIKPIINLFHFDMPWWLMEKGGWEARESIEAFRFYAKTAFEHFGDLITMWTTFNEPMVHVESGYLYGYHYPALHDMKKAVQVAYHTLLSHKMAVLEFNKLAAKGSKIGIILNISPTYSRGETKEDDKAAEIADLLHTKSFLDPCVLGRFPEQLIELLQANKLMPMCKKEDKHIIQENLVDFVGMNYYQPRRVQAPKKKLLGNAKAITDFYLSYIWPNRKMNKYRGWEIYPEALYDVAIMMRDKYHNIAWYVSENGMGVANEERFMDEEGIIQDDYRIEFMKEHLKYLYKGIQEGSNCFGFHTWTFIDCWSWLNGYTNRYGFYRVDLENNYQRSRKKSGLWFKELAESNILEN